MTAPAKLNLFLHVTGRRDDGYHIIDSLVVFADCGDVLTIEPASDFIFTIDGNFAGAFSAQERDAGLNGTNLVTRAARGLSDMAGRPLDMRMTLTKNLPLSAGLGGGSADAAAALHGLCAWWGVSAKNIAGFEDFALSLGADVPACLAACPVRVRGIGEKTWPVEIPRSLHVVLVNPLAACPTLQVFAAHDGVYRPDAPPFKRNDDLLAFLKNQRNDLQGPAAAIVAAIPEMIDRLAAQPGCALARMSGSGATCFGIFSNKAEAAAAAANIKLARPGWWVKSAGILDNQAC